MTLCFTAQTNQFIVFLAADAYPPPPLVETALVLIGGINFILLHPRRRHGWTTRTTTMPTATIISPSPQPPPPSTTTTTTTTATHATITITTATTATNNGDNNTYRYDLRPQQRQQTVTFLSILHNDYGMRGPFLIIAPLSTVTHWQREFQTWSDMNTIVFHGDMVIIIFHFFFLEFSCVASLFLT